MVEITVPIIEPPIPIPDAWIQSLPGPNTKEQERKSLASDISRFIQSGGIISYLKLRPVKVEWEKKRKKRKRSRKALAKLTPEEVSEIRRILKAKRNINTQTFEWIAMEYDTSAWNIRSIWNGETWKDVSP